MALNLSEIESLRLRVEQSKRFSNWIAVRIDGKETASHLRNRLSGGCFDLGIEHYNGIVLLVSAAFHAPAFALMRPLYESYVRGLWLCNCADENQLTDFTRGISKSLDRMVRELEKHADYGTGALAYTQARVKSSFDHFVHSGYLAVVRRQTDDAIEPTYELKELFEVLDFADATGGLCAIEIAQLARQEGVALEMVTQLQHGRNPGATLCTSAASVDYP